MVEFLCFSFNSFSPILPVFSVLTTETNYSRQRFKKAKRDFLFWGISSDILLISFFVRLFIFEEIFCWTAWVTFSWIVVLFSFHFNSHKTSYVCKKCKKELKKSHWFNVCLRRTKTQSSNWVFKLNLHKILF